MRRCLAVLREVLESIIVGPVHLSSSLIIYYADINMLKYYLAGCVDKTYSLGLDLNVDRPPPKKKTQKNMKKCLGRPKNNFFTFEWAMPKFDQDLDHGEDQRH